MKEGEHPKGDAMQLVFLVAFIVLWAADSFFLRLTTFLSGYVPLYIRLAFLAVAVVSSFRLIRAGHEAVERAGGSPGVITTGAFGYVRHPLYLGSMLLYLGLAVSTLSLISVLLFVVILVFYDHIAGYEERFMEGKHKEDYSAYKARTGRWFPRIGTSD